MTYSKTILIFLIQTTLFYWFIASESENDLTKCYDCNAFDDPACLNRVKDSYTFETSCNGSCGLGFVKQVLHRNCSYNFDEDTTDNFSTCNKDFCNDKMFNKDGAEITEIIATETTIAGTTTEPVPSTSEPPEELIDCFECETDENDITCLTDPNPTEKKSCRKLTGCYSKITISKGKSLKRGCADDLSDLKTCKEDKTCIICNDDYCNTKWNHCYNCKSSIDQPNCATVDENPDIEICDKSDHKCLVEVNSHTERKCVEPEHECTQPNCFDCSEPLCNGQIYPEHRISCHQCENCNDLQLKNKSKVCPVYNQADNCFLYNAGTADKPFMVRGCAKTQEKSYQECTKNQRECKTCNEKDCNSSPLFVTPKLKCHMCDTSDPSCGWYHKNEPEICKQKVYFYLDEYCYTRWTDDNKFERNCARDKGRCTEKNEKNCEVCQTDGCNNKNQIFQSCIQCNSRNEIECGEEAKGIEGKECQQSKQSYEERGCYVKLEGNLTTRGCALNLKNDLLEACKKDGKKNCIYCEGMDCNNQKISSGGAVPNFDGIKLVWIVFLLTIVQHINV